MSAELERAREILARLRADSTPRPWVSDVSYAAYPLGAFMSANVQVDNWDVATFHGANLSDYEGREQRARADRELFLLTTDPDLLDALEGLLRHHAEEGVTVSAIATWVRLVAAAIVAADERMSR